MRRCHSKMHVCEAKGRRQLSKKFAGNTQLFERFGVQERQGRKLATALSPLKKLNDYSYFPKPVHSVIRTGWPFLTMVGYRLSKPLWSDAL
jgi:hypothetical protein